MKIFLTAINAKYIHSNLAVYSLKAYARGYEEYITIGEYTINNHPDDILEQIYRQKPDVLCFSCYIWNLEYVEELMREYHKLCPEIPIWVGGPEVSYEVESFLKEHPQVTGVIIGEGEKTFLELCKYYVNQMKTGKTKEKVREGILDEEFVKDDDVPEDLSQIRGIAYRKSGEKEKILMTMPREPLDMSQIPFCYQNVEDFTNRIIYYESSRGCPFSCSYCLSSIDKKLRFRDIELVKKELAFFIEKRVPQVKFVDRTFNCSHKHAMEIWRFVKEHDNGVTNFHFEVSADLINEEELELIHSMRPGLIQLEIGVQSTNEATITEIHRTMKLELVKEIVKKIQSGENVHQHLDLIAGLPFEEYQTFAKSFDEIYALKPNQLQLGFLKVLKGSYMYEHAAEYGILYHTKPPYEVLKTKWLSFEDVLKIKQAEEMLEVYYNSGQFEVTMKLLELFYQSPFFMFQAMGEFYDSHGYFGMSHSRIRRCEILLEFVEETLDQNYIPLLKEGLTFDLYYRENLKSRPAWAPDPAEWKSVTRKYCKKGTKSHIEPFHYPFPDKWVKILRELPEYQKEPIYVLFDYENRDPLDHQAKVTIVEEEEKQ